MDSKLSRKYRPSQLTQVVGQKRVVETLKQASINDIFAQAYLFVGPRGCGKTSMARIVANLMTCENISEGKTCGKCKACKTIPTNGSLDVRELDGASNNGVEEARALIESSHYPPHELKRKVFVIDECHMLTTQANNALLKLVEEPPSYLNFIFCTTEPRKMLETSISRCQRFNFNRILSKDITERLKLIAKKEGVSIEEDGLYLIARMARGGLRDAIGYLEQIGTVGINKNITASNVHQYFGVADRRGILDIVKAIKTANLPLLLDQINDLVMAGANAKDIMYEISCIFRDMMVLKAHGTAKLIDLPDHEIEDIKKLSEVFKIAQLLKLSHLFADIERKLEFNINERWIMEATLINCVASLRTN